MDDHIEFCGIVYPLVRDRPTVVGREGDLAIDDNPFLHRHFLRLHWAEQVWWLENVGTQLTATVCDGSRPGQGYLAYVPPGAHVPLVFATTTVRFSAGSTTYELSINVAVPMFEPPPRGRIAAGHTTAGHLTLTTDQRLLLLALAEGALRNGDRSVSALPTSAEAAERLGWPLTKFNRKLDNVCQKLVRIGVRGLHGAPEQLAANRRFRLVEYALAARLVDVEDLDLLERAHARP